MRSHLFGDRGSSLSQLLLELGNGTFATHEGLISIASSDLCVLVEDIHTLISSVYPNIGSLLTMPLSWFSERALLAPRNDAVDKINVYILEFQICKQRITYFALIMRENGLEKTLMLGKFEEKKKERKTSSELAGKGQGSYQKVTK
ncbi:hypothetical protein LAZ67_10003089 [Cordylochernes scorpioides]|uniref:ATP-dependent DNA helicase n=1 Tax=Cordylochernes scorpioides TaxID=51811 RepID=A0ABY6KZB2_9ARAC|nr:hypothetical protein LAZ67_10003089 [Cordylochernes scorpioides]